MPWVERKPEVYQAYDGPSVGGFGLLPESAVPKLSPDPNLPSELGLQSIDEALPAPARVGNWVERVAPAAPPQAGLAASTIAPKGGTPYQPTVPVDQAHEIYRRLMQQQGPTQPQPEMSAAENLWRSGAKTYANNLLATPSIAADIASYPVRRLGALAQGKERPNWFGATPRADVDMLGAGLRAATSDMPYAEARENVRRNEAAREEARPTSSMIGGLGGDVATLAAGRLPFVSKLRAGEVAVEKAIKHGVPVSAREPMLVPGDWRKAVKQSPGFNNLKKLLARTGEAGAEGAALAILHEGDPVQSAAFTAGTQFVAGGAAQGLMHKFVTLPKMGRVANFAINVAAMSQLLYLADVALPGEAKDYEAQRGSAQKLIGGYLVGGALATVSARGRSGMASVNTPRLTDALASAPRNAMQSYIVDYLNSDAAKKQDFKGKMATLYSNMDKLSESQLRNLSAAFGAGKERFYKELDEVTKGLPTP